VNKDIHKQSFKMATKLEEASIHKSAVAHAGNVFCLWLKFHSRKTGGRQQYRPLGKPGIADVRSKR